MVKPSLYSLSLLPTIIATFKTGTEVLAENVNKDQCAVISTDLLTCCVIILICVLICCISAFHAFKVCFRYDHDHVSLGGYLSSSMLYDCL